MADEKITSMPALTTPASADVFPVVEVAGPTNKKITYANLLAALKAVITPMPSGVVLLKGNQCQFDPAADGLHLTEYDCATQTNAAGAFNGGGVGTKMFVGFNNYNNLAFSALTALSFSAKNIFDTVSPAGYISWNLLANFASGALSTANDYVNLVVQGLPAYTTTYYTIPTSVTAFPVNLATDYSFQCVGGTGDLAFTANSVSGSNVLTSVSIPAALTVGMHVYATSAFSVPAGTTIQSINVGASTVTLSNNATVSTTATYRQFGGVAPVSRTGTATSGSPTLTSIANTADLLVNMLVTGTGVPANTFILSMVANTSITLSNNMTITGSTTLSFIPAGKTGIPGNSAGVGIPWATIVANNPNGVFKNTTPTVAGGWGSADGGFPKNAQMPAFNIVQGSSSLTSPRVNALTSVTINSDVYNFAAS